MVSGLTVSANATVEVNEPKLRGLGTRMATSTSVGGDRLVPGLHVIEVDDSLVLGDEESDIREEGGELR